MAKALIVYGTRYGATANTSEVIAETLRQLGYETEIINAKKEESQNINEFDLIIAGTGLQFGRWTGEIEGFLKKFEAVLSQKKFAFFVSSMKPVLEREGKIKELEADRKMELDNKLTKYSFNPISIGFFGGIIDFNKMNIITRKISGSLKVRLDRAGFKESETGVYDLRDLDAINDWTREVAKK